MSDPTHRFASDTRSSAQLVEAHRRERISGDEAWDALAVLHYRGGATEFELGQQLTESRDPEDRAMGADILAQLGWAERTFLKQSVDALIRLLGDSNSNVVYCAAVGLGHRGDPRAIPPLLALADHVEPEVRLGVVMGLSGHDDDRAVGALVGLAHDVDRETRNWAMFGLGSQTGKDSQSIRDALTDGLNDADSEIRGEALVGLARRGDSRVRDQILREWESGEVSILSLEAAEVLADPVLLPRLIDLRSTLNLVEGTHFTTQFMRAIAACNDGIVPRITQDVCRPSQAHGQIGWAE